MNPDRVHGPGRAAVCVEMDLEVQVWTGTVARRADQADHRPCDHMLTFRHRRAAEHVAVPGNDLAGVEKINVPTAARCRR